MPSARALSRYTAAMPPLNGEKVHPMLTAARSLSSPSSVGDPSDASSRPPQKWSFHFGNRTRYLILILVTMCVSSIWSNILTFNFTIICMSPKRMNSADLGLDRIDEFAKLLSASVRNSSDNSTVAWGKKNVQIVFHSNLLDRYAFVPL